MYKLTWLKATTPALTFGGHFSRWTGASHLSKDTEFFQEEENPQGGLQVAVCSSPKGENDHHHNRNVAQVEGKKPKQNTIHHTSWPRWKNHTNPQHNRTKQATFRLTRKKSIVSFPLAVQLPEAQPSPHSPLFSSNEPPAPADAQGEGMGGRVWELAFSTLIRSQSPPKRNSSHPRLSPGLDPRHGILQLPLTHV